MNLHATTLPFRSTALLSPATKPHATHIAFAADVFIPKQYVKTLEFEKLTDAQKDFLKNLAKNPGWVVEDGGTRIVTFTTCTLRMFNDLEERSKEINGASDGNRTHVYLDHNQGP